MTSPWLSEALSDQIKLHENFQENTQLICEDIINAKLDITVFVERLVGVLTDTDDTIRARGLHIFSSVLKHLPQEFLTEEQLKYVSVFYLAKLRDDYLIITPALVGTLALFGMKHLPQNMHKELIRALLLNVNCQQQPYADRHNVYNIIHLFSINYAAELQEMGDDFVNGFINSMEGERDPRNLMLLFNLLPPLLKMMHLGEATERMFDVIACYFPISFQPLQDDPNAISRNDLAEKLCVCLCAVPTFSEFCLPLLTKKIDSTLKLARLDSLKLLEKSCETFTPLSYEPYLSAILSQLLEDMSPKTDIDIAHCAHGALFALVHNLCADETDTKLSTPFLKQILTSMQCLLAEAKDKASLELPLKAFLTTASSSKQSCIFICANALSLVLTVYSMSSDDRCKISILKWFTGIFQCCERHSILPDCNGFFKHMPEICLAAITGAHNDMKIAGLETLTSMTETIEPVDVLTLPEILNKYIHNETCESVSNASKRCLLSLAKKYPRNYLELINDKLSLNTLPDKSLQLERRIDIVCSLASVDEYCDLIVPRIFDVLSKNSDIKFSNTIIAALVNNFGRKQLFDDVKLQKIQCDHDILRHILLWSNSNIKNMKEKEAASLSKLISIIMHSQQSDIQRSLYSCYIKDYLERLTNESAFIIIIEALLKSSKPNVDIENLNEIISKAAEIATNETDTFRQLSACVLIANILNKYGVDGKIFELYKSIQERLINILDSYNCDDLIYKNVIELCSCVTKALLLRGDPRSSDWIVKITEILSKEKWGSQGAKSFKQIMNDSADLNVDCFCIVNKFYRQRVMQQFSSLTKDLKRSPTVDLKREPYLLAWAFIIQSVPKPVLKMEAKMILPILFESLDYRDTDILLASLSSLSYFIQMKNSSVIDSLQTILPRFLNLASFPTSMKVRMDALQCLFDVADCFPTILLLPYKQDTVIQMAPYLDDPKRLVRNIAVKARCRWFLVGSSEEKSN